MKRIVPKSSAYPPSEGVIAIILCQNMFLWHISVLFSTKQRQKTKKLQIELANENTRARDQALNTKGIQLPHSTRILC